MRGGSFADYSPVGTLARLVAWVAIDTDTKLVPSWQIGDRSGATAIELLDGLRSRLANRVQLTTDGHRPYLDAVEGTFDGDVG